MQPRFEQFIRERKYLHNVSPRTVDWYEDSLRWLPCESPTQEQLNDAVVRMREKGRKASGCNSAIRAVNAYLKWSGSALKVRQLKEPQNILPTLTDAQIKLIVGWKPEAKNFFQRRLHLLTLFLLDTGARISEALTLRVCDIDLDNLLAKLNGKGSKQRIVPLSFALRKAVYRFIADFDLSADSLLLAHRSQTEMGRNNVLRDVKMLCRKLGFDPPPRTVHSFRHTFAVFYLRRGGSVFHLQKVLGHSSLEMTRRYANLATSDLQAIHERVSLLSK